MEAVDGGDGRVDGGAVSGRVGGHVRAASVRICIYIYTYYRKIYRDFHISGYVNLPISFHLKEERVFFSAAWWRFLVALVRTCVGLCMYLSNTVSL